jgi:hypothetical protein
VGVHLGPVLGSREVGRVDVSALLNQLLAGPIDRAYLEMVRELERPRPKNGAS